MINKLHRRKRNTTGFLKTFFSHFWAFVLKQSTAYSLFIDEKGDTMEVNSLTNDYDLIGKVGNDAPQGQKSNI